MIKAKPLKEIHPKDIRCPKCNDRDFIFTYDKGQRITKWCMKYGYETK